MRYRNATVSPNVVEAMIDDYHLMPKLLEHFQPHRCIELLRLSAYEGFASAFYDEFADNIATMASLWWDVEKGQRTDEQHAKWLLDIDDDWCRSAIASGCMTEQDREDMLQAFRPRRGPRAARIKRVLARLQAIVECWVRHNRSQLDLSSLADVATRNLSFDMLCEYAAAYEYVDSLVDEVGADKIMDYVRTLGINVDD